MEFNLLGEALNDTSRCILRAMLELNPTPIKPETSATIMKTALGSGDEKRVFQQVSRLKLIGSKEGRGGGRWLTEKGVTIAKKLASIGATVTPTDCTD